MFLICDIHRLTEHILMLHATRANYQFNFKLCLHGAHILSLEIRLKDKPLELRLRSICLRLMLSVLLRNIICRIKKPQNYWLNWTL